MTPHTRKRKAFECRMGRDEAPAMAPETERPWHMDMQACSDGGRCVCARCRAGDSRCGYERPVEDVFISARCLPKHFYRVENRYEIRRLR